MPLAAQALLPFLALLGAAAIIQRRPRRPLNGWIAAAATGTAGFIALVELLRLAPGEHVDVPYLTLFPYADLVIRLDGLSLAFASLTLITAALLMLARLRLHGDRRDPWFGWLLTSAAACAVIFAHNLLLVYIALQLLTLAWSGALDETARRRRGLRLSIQVADVGLLLVAASAIQSVGTSAFSGVPSDTFGLATFLLVLVPVAARVVALAVTAGGPQETVAFEPAIAWVAPAGYLFMRMLALMGGRLPDRPTAVVLFVAAALVALAFAALAIFEHPGQRLVALLLVAQAAVALALSTGADPLMTVACTWLWLLVIPVAGLASVRVKAESASEVLSLLNLAMIPGSTAFIGLWLGGLALNARGLLFGMIPVAVAVGLAAVAALRRIALPRSMQLDVATAWAAALLVIAAFPTILMARLVLPAAATVRLVPGGTVATSPFGIVAGGGTWPALVVTVVAALVIGLAATRFRAIALPSPAREGGKMPWLSLGGGGRVLRGRLPSARLPSVPQWTRFLLWGAFGVAVLNVLTRP
ncbi:MAG: hypothetical protein M3Z28_07045 [Candidatus Dormibacteraeota bacterium]|nr:hypothetical protein [Candidatus Dormibacteraeota bacterium]